jgi:hypothetical protein
LRILSALFAPVLFPFEAAALRGRFVASGALPQSFVLFVATCLLFTGLKHQVRKIVLATGSAVWLRWQKSQRSTSSAPFSLYVALRTFLEG